MNLVLAHCGKEWRAQRGLLVAYTLMVFVGLCLGLSLAPTHYWFEEGFGVHALSWFVLAGMIGVVAFVAPSLVRAEFGNKDDQFVRRLPGALWPSFHGKLLFLVLATLSLPLLGLCVGEVFVLARGQNWHGLFEWRWDGEVFVQWPAVIVGGGLALLLVPWVWAIGTWMPGGRMALGCAALFVLLVGVGVFAVLRQSPGIEKHLPWPTWLWGVVPLGLAAAAVSWGRGRRGGGPLRSARFGLTVAAAGLVPPSLWLADCACAYHHPDLEELRELSVQGISPDGRHLLARGATHQDWACVSLRIDLQTGSAEQVAGIHSGFTPELVRPYLGHRGQRRHWREYSYGGAPQRAFDLTTGEWTRIDYDEHNQVALLPAGLRAEVVAELRERTPLRAPGGRRVWFEEDALCREETDGSVSRKPSPKEWRMAVRPAGHGFLTLGRNDGLFDLAGQRLLARTDMKDGLAWVVRDCVVLSSPGRTSGAWSQRDLGGTLLPCSPLANCGVLGLFDDDQLLCSRTRKIGTSPRLFLYRPADGRTTELRGPDDVPCVSFFAVAPLHEQGSLLARDPAGCIWLFAQDKRAETFLRIDTATLEITVALPHRKGDGSYYSLLGWPDARTALIGQDAQILRIDIATGERTVLFPRRMP